MADDQVVLINPDKRPSAARKAKWVARKKIRKAKITAADVDLPVDDPTVAAVAKTLEKSTISDVMYGISEEEEELPKPNVVIPRCPPQTPSDCKPPELAGLDKDFSTILNLDTPTRLR